jgi:hypothetical protein
MMKSLTFIMAARWIAGARLAASRQFLPVRRQGFTGQKNGFTEAFDFVEGGFSKRARASFIGPTESGEFENPNSPPVITGITAPKKKATRDVTRDRGHRSSFEE